MHDSANYKVMSRKTFAAIMVVLLSILAVGVWLGLDRLADYGDELQELAVTQPFVAAAAITQLLRALAILNAIVFCALALLIVRHGWSGWRSEFMPPKGSWILEGQRTWAGEPAVRIAKFKIAVGALLGVLGIVGSLMLWRLGDTVSDLASNKTAVPVTTSANRSTTLRFSRVSYGISQPNNYSTVIVNVCSNESNWNFACLYLGGRNFVGASDIDQGREFPSRSAHRPAGISTGAYANIAPPIMPHISPG